jgi:hypothetical protein
MWILPQNKCWKLEFFYTLLLSKWQWQFTLIYLSRHRCRCRNFQYISEVTLKFSVKSKLALHLLEMDTDPDLQALDADRDPPK